MIYAMSDIHGCLDALKQKMEYVDLSLDNRLILLGDYIDYGTQSEQTLRYIRTLQKKYGEDKLISLKGNHEAMLLEFLDEFKGKAGAVKDAYVLDNWLRMDSDAGLISFKTLVSQYEFIEFSHIAKNASFLETCEVAVEMIQKNSGDLISWIRKMPSYYETENQIFVHAGVDEEAEEDWKWGTSDETFLWKYPPVTGSFYKDIIAGHVGTGIPELQNDWDYHGIYHDGESHYYIDGSVYKDGGTLNLLVYNPEEERYGEIDDAGRQRWLFANRT